MIHPETNRLNTASNKESHWMFLRLLSSATVLGFALFASPAYSQTDSIRAKTSAGSPNQAQEGATVPDTSIRPYRVHVPEEDIADLHRRLAATRWPDQETVADRSQGVQLATMKELVHYWQTDYDWRKAEARLNASRFLTAQSHLVSRISTSPHAM